MTRHGFIDESGTKDDHEIMTVALILFDGAFTAQKLHKSLIQELFANHTKNSTKRDRRNSGLHYTDMSNSQRLAAAEILGKQSIQCFTSCFYHDGAEKSHEQRFEIYTSLIKLCLNDALEIHEHLDLTIAQQSNWMTYKAPLTRDLNEIVSEKSARLGFRTAKFGFESAAKAGIQLADFYAGTTRGHLLRHMDSTLGAPFDLVEHQIRDIKIHGADIASKAKG